MRVDSEQDLRMGDHIITAWIPQRDLLSIISSETILTSVRWEISRRVADLVMEKLEPVLMELWKRIEEKDEEEVNLKLLDVI